MILGEKLMPVCSECYSFLPQNLLDSHSFDKSDDKTINKTHNCASCIFARFCSKSCKKHHEQNCENTQNGPTVHSEQLDVFIQTKYKDAAGSVYFLYQKEKKSLKEKRIGGKPVGGADLSVFVKIDPEADYIGPYNYSFLRKTLSNQSLKIASLSSTLKTKYIFEILSNEFSKSFQTGTLSIKESFPQFVYLKIDDALLLRMFDRFEELRNKKYSNAEIPPYYPNAPKPFREPIGGHISVITGFELKNSPKKKDILTEMRLIQGKSFPVTFKKIISTPPKHWEQVSKLWMVIFDCPELNKLRTDLNLPSLPNGHEFHATLAVKPKIPANVADDTK